jgi:hypothetical protein
MGWRQDFFAQVFSYPTRQNLHPNDKNPLHPLPAFATIAARQISGNGSVAQSVEQGIENPRVGGSIPS